MERPPGADAARAVVERLNERLLDVANRSDELGQAGREAELRAVVLETFDVPLLARASLGGYWQQLDAAQRALWLETYTEFHIVATAHSWRRDRGARFDYLGEEPGGRGTVLVKTGLDRIGQGFDVRRDYRLRDTDGTWRIIDLFTPGSVSQVGMRRSEYLAVIARSDFDTLIEDMTARIAKRRSE